jgi:hypothetical protein
MRIAICSGLFALALTASAPAAFAQSSWQGDFETGALDQWSYLLNEAGLSVVQEPVLLGSNAGQVRISDQDLWSNNLNRVELQRKPQANKIAEGSEIFFGWSLYLPEALTTDDHQLGYWETEETYQQVMSLHARGQDLSFNTNSPYAQHWQGTGRLTPGVWHRVVFHIKWASDAAQGEVNLWFDGEKVVDAVKVRTYLQHPAFVQLGILRDTIAKVETLFIDEALEGSSYEAVALTASLPAPTGTPAAPSDTAPPSDTARPVDTVAPTNTAAPTVTAAPADTAPAQSAPSTATSQPAPTPTSPSQTSQPSNAEASAKQDDSGCSLGRNARGSLSPWAGLLALALWLRFSAQTASKRR